MELTKAQEEAEEDIRIIMSEEFVGSPECELAYVEIINLIEEHALQEHSKLLKDVYDNFVEFECRENAALFAKKFNLEEEGQGV